MERQHPALSLLQAAVWLAASFVLYVALAIAIYVPLLSFGPLPHNRDSWSAAFYARLSAGIFLHQVLALIGWLLLARWIGISRTGAATLSIAGIAVLAYATTAFVMIGVGT